MGFYELNELGPGQLGLCGPRWTRSDLSGPGAPGPLSQGRGIGKTEFIFQTKAFSLYSHFLSSLSSVPATVGAAAAAGSRRRRATTTEPPPPRRKAGSTRGRKWVYAFGVSLHDNGLDCQCGLILGVFVYD